MSVIEATGIIADGRPVTRSTAMQNGAAAYCDDHALSLHEVPTGGWLIRRSQDVAGDREVLGCIDEHDSGFELMEIVGGFRWSTFDSLLAAIIHLRAETAEHTRLDDGPAPGAERRFDRRLDSRDAPISGLPRSRR